MTVPQVLLTAGIVITTACGNTSQETRLEALLQRPEPQAVNAERSKVVTGFHLAMRRADYQSARQLISAKCTFSDFSAVAQGYYRLEEGVMGLKIIGDDLIPWEDGTYDNPTYGAMARLRVMALTNYGWQPVDFYLRDDGADDPASKAYKWRVLLARYPDFMKAEDF